MITTGIDAETQRRKGAEARGHSWPPLTLTPQNPLAVGDKVNILCGKDWVPFRVDWIDGEFCGLLSADEKRTLQPADCVAVSALRNMQAALRKVVAA